MSKFTSGFSPAELAKFQAVLDGLAPKIANRVMRGAVNAGGKVLLSSVVHNTPIATGQLRQSMAMKIKKLGGGGLVSAAIGATGPRAFIMKFLEYGTSRGVAASGFMAKSFHAAKADAIEAAEKYIKKKLQDAKWLSKYS